MVRKIWTVKDKKLLNLILGREGGKTTTDIIDMILDKPLNKNQLANILHVDYNTVDFHLKIVEKYKYVTKEKFGKVYYYHPTDKLYDNLEEYNILKDYLRKK